MNALSGLDCKSVSISVPVYCPCITCSSIFQNGRVPLPYAADGGHIEAMRALVTEFNCPPDCRDDVDPSFYQAVRLPTTSTYTLCSREPARIVGRHSVWIDR